MFEWLRRDWWSEREAKQIDAEKRQRHEIAKQLVNEWRLAEFKRGTNPTDQRLRPGSNPMPTFEKPPPPPNPPYSYSGDRNG